MHIFTKVGLGSLALGISTAVVGCSGASDGTDQTAATDQTATTTEALGQRCTVSGNPRVTTGCQAGQTCGIVACTNSVPPTCWGTCQGRPAPKPTQQCEGAFNCLCGTPTCIDGEWTCVGSCGGGGEAPQPTKKCEGAFNCLCGTATCVDGDWTCVGDCGNHGEVPQ